MRGFKFLTKDYNPPTTRGARGKREGGGRVGVPSFTWAPIISQLPKNPGVYAFLARRSLGEGGKKGAFLLYIGKAANIKERVKNHFQQSAFRDNLFVNQVAKIGYIKTNSEIEALILEANLIKKYQPKYNIVWRDDKNYFFVGIIKGDFPQVFITHQPSAIAKFKMQKSKVKIKNQNSKFIGPFVDGGALKQTLKVLRKVFPYRTCKTLPNRPCLWYQLDRCPAPCLLKSSLGKQLDRFTKLINWGKECRRNIQNLIKILQGRKYQVLINLIKEMKGASKLQDFEKAAKIRDQITALKKILAHAKIFEPAEVKLLQNQKFWPYKRIEAYDISNIQGQEATGAMVTFINGQPDKNFYRRFKIKVSGKPDDIAMLKEVLTRRFKHLEWGLPDLILVDGGVSQLNAASRCLKWSFKQVKLKLMALAKKKNELYIEGRKQPILLKNMPREIFNLILQLRDEAHRFAISYHRKLRKKGLLEN